MIVKKPSILIYTYEPEAHTLREICAGIEEEGVFFEIKEQASCSHTDDARIHAARFAWQAAQDSMPRVPGSDLSGQILRFRCADFRRPLCRSILYANCRSMPETGSEQRSRNQENAFQVTSGLTPSCCPQ